MSGWWVRLGGRPAHLLGGRHGAPTYETTVEGGLGEASFEFVRPPKVRPNATNPRTRMEVMLGPQRMWLGTVLQYEDGRVVGQALSRRLYKIPALDGFGAATRHAQTAAMTAESNPWRHFIPDPYGVLAQMGTAPGDGDEPLMVGDLFDLCASQLGMTWGQDENGRLRLYSAVPGTPRWMVAPAAGTLGPTTQGQASSLVLRYTTATGRATETVTDPDADFEEALLVDLTDEKYGVMTAPEVIARGEAALAAARVEMGWANPLDVTSRQLLTLGGARAFLPAVRAGHPLRLHSLMGQNGVTRPIRDVVIGRTIYTAGARTIRLEATNTVPYDLAGALAAD